MTMQTAFDCGDKDKLLAYLYGEAPPEECAAVEAHLAACPACAAELEALREVRTSLASWAPPDVALGFRLVRGAGLAREGPWWRRGRSPAWAAAAAAVVLVATAAAIAVLRIEVRVGPDGVVVRTGGEWPTPPSAPRVGADRPWRADLIALEERLRRELAARVASPASPPAVDEAALMRRVRALVEASEARQRRELALRVAQVTAELQAERQADLRRIDQRLGQLAGLTGAEVAKQRELVNYLMRVSSRRP